MKFAKRLRLIIAATLSFGVLPAATPTLAQTGGTVGVERSDPVMAAAIKKAEDTLPSFFQTFDTKADGAERFSIKIKYPTRMGPLEHIWATVISHRGDQVTAQISNQPVDIPNLQGGQTVTVPKSQLSDWMFWRNGKIFGGQTIRAVLPKLPAEQAAQLRAVLAPE
jgi:uncharacterized protein YegJ (DUF2314 family)